MVKRKRNLIFKSKKANAISDSILVLMILTILAFVSLMAFSLLDNINTSIQQDSDFGTTSKNSINDLHSRFPPWADGLFIMILVLLWGIVIVFSFSIDAHPIFFIFSVLGLSFVLLLAAHASNLYEEFTGDAAITTFADNFPMTNFIMDNLLTTILCIGFSVVLVLFGKNRLA